MWLNQVTQMNEPQPANIPPDPKVPGEPGPTDLPGQTDDNTRPLLEEDDQAEDAEEVDPEEPVGTPETNQQVP